MTRIKEGDTVIKINGGTFSNGKKEITVRSVEVKADRTVVWFKETGTNLGIDEVVLAGPQLSTIEKLEKRKAELLQELKNLDSLRVPKIARIEDLETAIRLTKEFEANE